MNISPIPHTPIRTPQPGTSAKNLQLTPIWEEVVKNNRLPADVNQDLIFKEISLRLEDLEWPVRQHAFRVLCDIIPVVSNERLDERIIANNILSKLVINLGHPAPGIRKVALEAIKKYLKKTKQSEKMLENFLQFGVREKDLINNDQAGILRENITLATIISLMDVLKPFLLPENGGYSITQSFLAKIMEALGDKIKNPLYREKCVETLWKLRDIVGEGRFYQTVKNVPEKEYLMNLMKNEDKFDSWTIPVIDGNWSDKKGKPDHYFGTTLSQESDSFDLDQQLDKKSEESKKESSEEFSDGTDTETYTKEPAPVDPEDEGTYYQVDRAEVATYTPPSFVAIDGDCRIDCFQEENNKNKLEKDEKADGSTPSSPRVVLEAEFQFSKNKAITMKLMEDEKDGPPIYNQIDLRADSEKRFATEDGDLIMKVLHNADEEKIRTPRRVRFGGEVIKLRTPDSDTTDITIEIHEADDDDDGGDGDPSARKEPTRELITIKQGRQAKEDEEKESADAKNHLSSHIPLPVMPAMPASPASKTSGRDSSPFRKFPSESRHVQKDNYLSPKTDSFDSVPSSSGSEVDVKEKWTEDGDVNFWQWADLKLVEENILKDLKNKENWKIQYQALEQLKSVLINPKTVEKLEKNKNQEKVNSLAKCLLYEMAQSSSQQVTALAMSIISQLMDVLSKDVILLHVEDVVQGLCKYIGGCKNLNLKIESVQALKTLFGLLEPSSVIDVLIGDGCLFSSVSRMRENSLLAIMYATMTFPSDFFDMDKILEKVADSAADVRRRVRHASLEAIAVLSQFCSSKALADNVGRVAERLATPAAKAQLVAAVQARLSRRLLPTVSSEGLVLYALQIPASRRFGNVGNPIGADVDWILSGTGSVSTGSAKSKSQLNAAQRLEIKPTAPLSPSKWAQNDWKIKPNRDPISKSASGENPWTIQKNRTESFNGKSGENLTCRSTRFYKTQSAGDLCEGKASEILKSTENILGDKPKTIFGLNFLEANKSYRPEDITWALVPISALEEPPHFGRERSNSLWGESVGDNSHFLSPSLGPLRPLYLKLQPTHEQLLLSRSSDDVRRNPYSELHGVRKGQEKFSQEELTEVRLLTPTILREKNYSEIYYQNGKIPKSEVRGSGENTTRIPILNTKNPQRVPRVTPTVGIDRKISDPEENLSSCEKATGINTAPNGLNGPPVFLPSIHPGQTTDTSPHIQKSPTTNKYTEVDEVKLQDTMTQLSGLLTASKGVDKSVDRDFHPVRTQQTDTEAIPNGNDLIENQLVLDNKIQAKLFDRGYVKNHQTLPSDSAVSSAPAVISSAGRDQIPSTSSSNSTDFGTLSGSELRLRRLTNDSGALEVNGRLPYRNYNTYNPKLKGKTISLSKNSSKVGINGNSFPDNLKAFDRPKEGLDTCFGQLESQQWEVNMVGLSSLVRLLRHHPAIVLSQLHPIIVALGRQIRNLRSQVARAACQASAEMFVTLKRNVESDLDELSGPLFHRSADTNRFIRADCNHALDNMTDNVGHGKVVTVIISKGTTHQNATVRAVAARLLLRLSERVGPDKLLSLPKEIRDKMLQAGANLLMEGKLETRAFAKQVFRVWSSHSSFSNLILEAVPPNVMRHISKTLVSLKS